MQPTHTSFPRQKSKLRERENAMSFRRIDPDIIAATWHLWPPSCLQLDDNVSLSLCVHACGCLFQPILRGFFYIGNISLGVSRSVLNYWQLLGVFVSQKIAGWLMLGWEISRCESVVDQSLPSNSVSCAVSDATPDQAVIILWSTLRRTVRNNFCKTNEYFTFLMWFDGFETERLLEQYGDDDMTEEVYCHGWTIVLHFLVACFCRRGSSQFN